MLFVGTWGTYTSLAIFAMLVIVACVYGTAFFGSVWMPTPSKIIDITVREAKLKRGHVFYDLGSGDGRVIMQVAKNSEGKAIGIEIDLLKYIWSKMKIKLHGINNANVLRKNYFQADISDADAVFIFAPQATVDRLQKKLKMLKKGCKIISYGFKCNELRLVKELKKEKVYIYRI